MPENLANTAAWQTAPKVNPLQFGPGPDQNQLATDEVVIKVAAVAINPVDWKLQIHYPRVLASTRLMRRSDARRGTYSARIPSHLGQ